MRGILRSAGTSIIGSSLTGLIFLLNVNLAVWKVIISVKDLGLLKTSVFFSVSSIPHTAMGTEFSALDVSPDGCCCRRSDVRDSFPRAADAEFELAFEPRGLPTGGEGSRFVAPVVSQLPTQQRGVRRAVKLVPAALRIVLGACQGQRS